MTTLLITGIGGDISQGVARVVRETRPDWRIVGVDAHDRHGGALLADAFHTVPLASSTSYKEAMDEVAGRHRIDFCLPISDAELGAIVATGTKSFGSAPLLGVSRRAVEIGLDKLATARFIESLGIPAPWTHEASTERGLSCFVWWTAGLT